MSYFPIFVEVKRITDKAVLVIHKGEDLWIPRSLIDNKRPIVPGHQELLVKSWFCDKEDLF